MDHKQIILWNLLSKLPLSKGSTLANFSHKAIRYTWKGILRIQTCASHILFVQNEVIAIVMSV